MKRTILAGMLLAAALPLFAQNPGNDWQQFDLFGGIPYNGTGSSLQFVNDDVALKVSGTASVNAGGYVIESKTNPSFSGNRRLMIRVSGVSPANKYDLNKLLKLEVNGAVLPTVTPRMQNSNDQTYINARNGEAEFDISPLRNIRKLNLVFYNCTVADVKIEVFYK